MQIFCLQQCRMEERKVSPKLIQISAKKKTFDLQHIEINNRCFSICTWFICSYCTAPICGGVDGRGRGLRSSGTKKDFHPVPNCLYPLESVCVFCNTHTHTHTHKAQTESSWNLKPSGGGPCFPMRRPKSHCSTNYLLDLIQPDPALWKPGFVSKPELY